MKTTTNRQANSALRDDSSDLMKHNIRMFIAMESALEQCSDIVKSVVYEMIAIVRDEGSSAEEKEMAISTIIEAIYPSQCVDELQALDRAVKSDDDGRNAEMVREEEHFAERLQTLMAEKKMTQVQLAEATGVGQSAISNMVNRQCRPQKRTIVKIAAALQVDPTDLWPGFTQ